jgi:biotin transporter BioY
MQSALATGLYPFILPDVVKLAMAAALLPTLWRLIGRRDERSADPQSSEASR